jgi:hypothetical protein
MGRVGGSFEYILIKNKNNFSNFVLQVLKNTIKGCIKKNI